MDMDTGMDMDTRFFFRILDMIRLDTAYTEIIITCVYTDCLKV